MADGTEESGLTPEDLGISTAEIPTVAGTAQELVEAPVEQDTFTRYREAIARGDVEAEEAAALELDAGVDECIAKISELRGSRLPAGEEHRFKFTSKTSEGEDVVLRVTDYPADRPTVKGITRISAERVEPGVDSDGRRIGRTVGSIEVDQIPGFKRGVSFVKIGDYSRYDIFDLPEPRRDSSADTFNPSEPIPNPVAKTAEFLDMLERATLTHAWDSEARSWVEASPPGSAPAEGPQSG
jgi:hypothetical protein